MDDNFLQIGIYLKKDITSLFMFNTNLAMDDFDYLKCCRTQLFK